MSVISTSLSDSKVSNGDTSKTALTKDAAKDGEVVKDELFLVAFVEH